MIRSIPWGPVGLVLFLLLLVVNGGVILWDQVDAGALGSLERRLAAARGVP